MGIESEFDVRQSGLDGGGNFLGRGRNALEVVDPPAQTLCRGLQQPHECLECVFHVHQRYAGPGSDRKGIATVLHRFDKCSRGVGTGRPRRRIARNDNRQPHRAKIEPVGSLVVNSQSLARDLRHAIQSVGPLGRIFGQEIRGADRRRRRPNWETETFPHRTRVPVPTAPAFRRNSLARPADDRARNFPKAATPNARSRRGDGARAKSAGPARRASRRLDTRPAGGGGDRARGQIDQQ